MHAHSGNQRGQVQALTRLYFVYFLSLGVYQPYLNLYFKRIGLTGAAIGALSALRPISIMLIPPIAGVLADRYGYRRRMLVWLLLASVVPFYFMLSVQDFTWLFLGTLLFSGLSGPVLPMIDANALEVLGGDRARYGLMRRWGSFGYMLAVIITGQLGGRLGILAILRISGLALLMAGLLAWSYGREERSSMPNHQESSRPWWVEVGVSWRSIVHLPGMSAFLLAGFLGWFAATTYYNFFTIFADSLGMSEGLIGLAWGIGIVSEIVMLSLSSRLLDRLGAKTLFAVGLLAAALRWSLYAVVQNAYLILGLQALHGFTFGLLHAGAVTYLHTRVAPERRSGAQALWASITTGIAGVTGAYILGPLSDIIGLRTTFAVSGVLAIIGALIGWFGLRQVDESVTTL